MDIRNSEHTIKTTEDLFFYCNFAKDVINFAEKISVEDNLSCYFDVAYCNWNTETHFVIFNLKSDTQIGTLSLKIIKINDKYEITMQNKTIQSF